MNSRFSWKSLTPYWRTVVILALLFVVLSGTWLHRVPGLMGDEASEGQNVIELLQREGITLQGERSYIGPAIDYVRVPFVGGAGYSALALRLPLFFVSIATFFLGAHVFRRLFGERAALLAVALVFFSFQYTTYQRMGWAITLFPFFALLLIAVLDSRLPQRKLLSGLIAGLGLHTHIMFLPTLFGVAGATGLRWLIAAVRTKPRALLREALSWWPAVIGFWAAFATQFVILLQFTEDQGSPGAVAESITERFAALPSLIPVVLSGSSFVARYTGTEFMPGVLLTLTIGIGLLAVLALVVAQRKAIVWLWALGLGMHLYLLLYMIDRFTLRYFVVFSLGLLVLTGVGLNGILERLRVPVHWNTRIAIGLAVVLCILNLTTVFIPFLRTGGSLNDFSLGNRTNSAAALVDIRSLITCLRDQQGVITSENVHIHNRLLYVSNGLSELTIGDPERPTEADILVHYNTGKEADIPLEQRHCPELIHFVAERRKG